MDNAGRPDGIIIRFVQGADAGAIARIYAHHVLNGTASFDIVPRTAAETEQKIADILSKGWPFLVAERDESTLGYAYATAFRDRPAYGFTCEDSIYVDPEYLGQGVGVQLLRALMALNLLQWRCTANWDSRNPAGCVPWVESSVTGLTAFTCKQNLVTQTRPLRRASQPKHSF
jgi:L-amino acid N-acyltransferase YncA